MNLLSSKELAKLVYLDYKGEKFTGYKLKIKNTPLVRVSNGEQKRINSCTCAHHSIKDIGMKKHCRYTKAVTLFIRNEREKA